MKKYLASLSLVAILASSLTASPASKEDVMSLLEKTGTIKVSKQVADQTMAFFEKNSKTDKEKKAIEKVKSKMNIDSLINDLVPVYQKYYTKEDIQGLIKFYGTPLGQKLIKTMPDIAKDSMVVSQKWTQKLVQEIKAEAGKK